MPFHEEQIIKSLKEVEARRTIAEICRDLGISDATFYTRRRKYSGMQDSQAKKLKQMKDENRRLKQLLAEATLDNQALKAVLA